MASLRKGIELSKYYGAFSHDVTAAILVFQNKKVSRTHISVRQGEIWVRDYQNNQTAILLQPRSPGFSLLPWCPKQILWARVCGCFTSYSTMKQKWLFELSSSKNEKSKDYCKADTEQRVLFFYNNISAGHPASFFLRTRRSHPLKFIPPSCKAYRQEQLAYWDNYSGRNELFLESSLPNSFQTTFWALFSSLLFIPFLSSSFFFAPFFCYLRIALLRYFAFVDTVQVDQLILSWVDVVEMLIFFP